MIGSKIKSDMDILCARLVEFDVKFSMFAGYHAPTQYTYTSYGTHRDAIQMHANAFLVF